MDKVDLKCAVCGEKEFTRKEGFYFCDECGTQSQQVRQIEVEKGPADGPNVTSSKFRQTKTGEKLELTSWECFNYLLYGLVNELIELGAPEKIKLISLQLWTTYLRKSEVAFFAKKQSELPRLTTGYNRKDAKILYNVSKEKKERKSTPSRSTGRTALRKQLRKLATSEYDALSASQSSFSRSTTLTTLSQGSSSTGVTSRPVRLTFTRKARRFLKTKMHKKHLQKHEEDYEMKLDCHKFYAGQGVHCGPVVDNEKLTRRLIYTLLYLALNLSGGDIQMADMLRYMREGHISTSHFKHLFPENIADECVKTINMGNYYGKTLLLSSSLRRSAYDVCHFLHIRELVLPDISKLVERYVQDLNLPVEIAEFCDRLIRLCPPEMELPNHRPETPCYEGRAMAYIIFVLKLIFGLDGEKENLISNTARTVNEKLRKIGNRESMELFVWNDWIRFMEMRSIIITQCHLPTSLFLKKNVSQDQDIKYLKEQNEVPYEDVVKHNRSYLLNMEAIFAELELKHERKVSSSLKFPPSLTPYSDYLNEIKNNLKANKEVFIPPFMKQNFSATNINAFLNPNKLKRLLASNSIELKVKKLKCKSEKHFIGIVKNMKQSRLYKEYGYIRVRKVDTNISKEEWLENIPKNSENLGEIRDLQGPAYDLTDKYNGMSSETREFLINLESCEPSQKKAKLHEDDNINDLMSVRSFDLFSELNMDALELESAQQPRSNLESDINLLADVSDEEVSDAEEQANGEDKIEFLVSNFDYWTLLGNMKYLSSTDDAGIETACPKTFLWLVKTCADIIESDFRDVYKELIAIENQFIFVLEPLDDFKSILKYKTEQSNTQIRKTIEMLNRLW